jgi:hypothetical protein
MMRKRKALAVRSAWLALPYGLQLLLGCSFDRYPLLAPQEEALPLRADAAQREHPTAATHLADAAISGNGSAGLAADSAPSANAAPDAMLAVHDAAPPPDALLAADASRAAMPSDMAAAIDAAVPSDPSTTPDASSIPADAPPVPADAMPTRPCRAGTYVGDFSCALDPTGVTPLTVMTRVMFTLQPSSPGSALRVASSELAFDVTGFRFIGELAGGLDCAAGSFHAEVVNGTFMSPVVPILTPFSGRIDGQLDASASSLAGTWSFTVVNGAICSGPWRAALQP